jgi:hypothetical protein
MQNVLESPEVRPLYFTAEAISASAMSDQEKVLADAIPEAQTLD